MHNLKTDIPRVKIRDYRKVLHKFTSLKEIKKSNYSIQTSVLMYQKRNLIHRLVLQVLLTCQLHQKVSVQLKFRVNHQ